MDHLADTRCLDALRQAVKDECLHVRRHAAHALACQGCKPTPLELDVLGMLLELATKDPSLQVRRVATANLVLQPPSRRAAKTLREMIRNETDEKLIRRARFALRHHTTAA
jgi:HEAT repeat protein